MSLHFGINQHNDFSNFQVRGSIDSSSQTSYSPKSSTYQPYCWNVPSVGYTTHTTQGGRHKHMYNQYTGKAVQPNVLHSTSNKPYALDMQSLQEICDPARPPRNQSCSLEQYGTHPFYCRKRSDPAEGMTRTREKYRVVYNDKQRTGLENEYKKSRFITLQRKTELSSSINLSDRQIKIWFQNRRAKERRESKREHANVPHAYYKINQHQTAATSSSKNLEHYQNNSCCFSNLQKYKFDMGTANSSSCVMQQDSKSTSDFQLGNLENKISSYKPYDHVRINSEWDVTGIIKRVSASNPSPLVMNSFQNLAK